MLEREVCTTMFSRSTHVFQELLLSLKVDVIYDQAYGKHSADQTVLIFVLPC